MPTPRDGRPDHQGLAAAVELGLSNSRLEGINGKIRLIQRRGYGYGREHPTGAVTIPEDCIQADVHYRARTPTQGRLREAFVMAIEPASATSALRAGLDLSA
jgi:hypothetical protein